MGRLELTLAILKPHVLKNPIAFSAIRSMILSQNFKVIRSKRHQLSLKEAEQFYGEHKDKFFYNRLVSLMTSGHSDLYILAKYNAIANWRKLMGPTKVSKADFEASDTIRGLYGLSDTRNATHGSDSPESAAREMKITFPEFSIEDWYVNEEQFYQHGDVEFCDETFVHRICRRQVEFKLKHT